MSILPLNLRNVSLSIDGDELLRDIGLHLEAGPRTIILGANGAGKSLLLRVCHGLMGPSSGDLEWAEPTWDGRRKRHAMVFQKPVLLRRSVQANIGYALKLMGMARTARAARVAESLALVGLTEFATRPARLLSGGEQQRLALARAWALAPEVLFLDEPTASLDPGATQSVEGIIQEIHDAGTKIVMTTHDLAQARRLADEIVFLHRGSILEQSQADDFFKGPRNDIAAAFLEGKLVW